jgi:hypothetical protein
MERCWHGKFTGAEQCLSEGRYGNPDYRGRADRPGLDATIRFMRAARWCAAHKHPGDQLLGPSDGGTAPQQDAASAAGDAAR